MTLSPVDIAFPDKGPPDDWDPDLSTQRRFGFESGVGCSLTSDNVPADDSPNVVRRFREWCQERVDSDETGHSYSRRHANRLYARAKDVDRWFATEYDRFTTVHVVYCRPRLDDESVVEHAQSFYPRSVTRKRRRLLKSLGVWDDYAMVRVLAPKPDPNRADNRVPGSHPPTTHAHSFYWIPGTVSASEFGIGSVTDDDVDVHVSAQTHQSDSIDTPESVINRGTGLDDVRGDTTALPQELGANLPMLQTRLDARGLAETRPYALRWCAELRHGSDRTTDTKGVQWTHRHGVFGAIADRRQWRNRLQDGYLIGTGLCDRL